MTDSLRNCAYITVEHLLLKFITTIITFYDNNKLIQSYEVDAIYLIIPNIVNVNVTQQAPLGVSIQPQPLHCIVRQWAF